MLRMTLVALFMPVLLWGVIDEGESDLDINNTNVNKNFNANSNTNINILDDGKPNIHVDGDDVQKIMHLDSKGRADDWVEMYQRLREEYPNAKIYAIVDGQSLENVIGVEALGQNTLLKITTFSRSGPKSKSVKVEKMDDLGIRSYHPNKVRIFMPVTPPPQEP